MENRIVIAVDPGLTSGVCTAHNIQPNGDFDVLDSFALAWSQRFELRHYFDKLLKSYYIDTLVVERFRLFPNKAQDQAYNEFPSCRVIGLVEAYCEQLDIFDKLVFQEPFQRQRVAFMPQHYQQVRKTMHQRDAYQHARYFIVNRVFKAVKNTY